MCPFCGEEISNPDDNTSNMEIYDTQLLKKNYKFKTSYTIRTNSKNDILELKIKLLANYHNNDNSFLEKNYDDILNMAVKGDTDAKYFLGLCYQNGLGTYEDKSKAKYWYKKVLCNNNPAAMNNLGTVYESEQKLVDAVHYYKLALSNHQAISALNLCILCLKETPIFEDDIDYISFDEYLQKGISILENNKYQPEIECLVVNYICAILGCKNASAFSSYIVEQGKDYLHDNISLSIDCSVKMEKYLSIFLESQKVYFAKYGSDILSNGFVKKYVKFILDYYDE